LVDPAEEDAMTDEFAVIGHDEHGHPHVRYHLDPREVTIVRDPARGDEVIGYVWEPTGPVPQPVQTDPWANPRLIGCEGIGLRLPDKSKRRPWWRRWWRR
jgi:hypothetical protein